MLLFVITLPLLLPYTNCAHDGTRTHIPGLKDQRSTLELRRLIKNWSSIKPYYKLIEKPPDPGPTSVSPTLLRLSTHYKRQYLYQPTGHENNTGITIYNTQ